MNKIILSTLTLFLAFFVGCTKFENYESKKLADAPTVSAALEEAKDSSVVVSFSSSATGFVSFVLMQGVANEKPDSTALIQLNVSALESGSYEVLAAGEKIMHEFGGLTQNTVYEVFAVAQNDDGVLSLVPNALMITTTDKYSPVIESSTPASSTTADKAVDFEITLTFNEPIGTADASKFTFTYFLEGAEAKAASATVNPNNPYQVIVTQSRDAHKRDYIFLSYSAGAVLDIAGNPIEAFESGVDEETGGPVGLYWRTEAEPFAIDAATFVPANGSAVSDPEFVIEFKAPVNVSNKAIDGSIKMVVVGAGVKSVYDVPAANITVADDNKTIQVVKPMVPTFGEWVYIEIAAGTFTDAYGNPNIVIESGIDGVAGADDPVTEIGWLISYGYEIDILGSNYNVVCISTITEDEYTFNVSIEVDPEIENGVIIKGLENSQEPIKGVFDGDFGTLTIAQDQSLGDLMGDGSEVLLWSNTSATGDLIGQIQADGTIIMDWASYIVGGEYNGYYYERYYDSVWTISEPSGISGKNVSKKVIGFPRN